MRRPLTFAVFGLLSIGSLLAQFNLGSPPLPSASVTRFVPTAISLRDVTFDMDVSIRNPYPVRLPLESVRVTYNVEGTQVFEARTTERFEVPANGQQTNTFKVVLPYQALIDTVRNYAEKDYLNTRADIRASIPLPRMPGLQPTFDFDATFNVRIPAIKPRVSIVGFQVEPPSQDEVARALQRASIAAVPQRVVNMLNNILAGRPAEPVVRPEDLDLPFRVSFDIELENQSKAAISFPSLTFVLTVDGVPLVNGQSSQVSTTGTKTVTRVTNTFSSKSLNEAIRSAFQRGSGSFRITGQTQLQLPREVLDRPLPMNFDEQGSFRLR